MKENRLNGVLVPALTLPVALIAFLFEFMGDRLRESDNYEVMGVVILVAVLLGLAAYFNGLTMAREAEELEALLTMEMKKAVALSRR